MKFYFGGIGFRGGKPRLYGGLYQRLGPAAIGLSRNGKPWAKVSARRLLNPPRPRGARPGQLPAPPITPAPPPAIGWTGTILFLATVAVLTAILWLSP